MDNYFVATRLDAFDVPSGTRDFAAALAAGTQVCVPAGQPIGAPNVERILGIAATPDRALCGPEWRWPCRLFEIEFEAAADGRYNRGGTVCCTVLAEHPAHLTLGVNGERAAAHVATAVGMSYTVDQLDRIFEWGRVREADEATRQWMSTQYGLGPAAEAVWAYLRRHLEPRGQYVADLAAWALLGVVAGDRLPPARLAALTGPWVRIVGPLP